MQTIDVLPRSSDRRRVAVQLDGNQVLFEAPGVCDHPAVGRKDGRVAVEDKLVVAPHLVDEHKEALVLAGEAGKHVATKVTLAEDVRRRGDVDEHLGAGVRMIPGCSQFLASPSEGILAVWGQQPHIIGETGLGLIFDPKDFVKWHTFTDATQGYGVYLGPRLKDQRPVHVRMRLVGVWSEGGVASADTFIPHLKDLALRFTAPVVVTSQ